MRIGSDGVTDRVHRGSFIARALGGLGLALLMLLLPLHSGAETPRLLCFGDSLITGHGLPQGRAFPAQLERALRKADYSVEVVNAGVSGETSDGGAARLEWVLSGGDFTHALVVLGANDALRGLDPGRMETNLEQILDILQGHDIPVLLAGVRAPRNLDKTYRKRFEAVFPRLATRFDVRFYPHFLKDVAARPELNQGDGIHPNAEGFGVVVSNILPTVQTLLGPPRSDD
jgi:acyl-CoA thioesterase-1